MKYILHMSGYKMIESLEAGKQEVQTHWEELRQNYPDISGSELVWFPSRADSPYLRVWSALQSNVSAIGSYAEIIEVPD